MRKKKKKLATFSSGQFLTRVKKEATKKKGKLRAVLILVGLVLLGYLYFAGDFGFVRIFSLWKEKRELRLEIKKLEAKIIDLEVERKRLKNDLYYIERVAREKYGMAKEGEKIYKFVEEPKDSSK